MNKIDEAIATIKSLHAGQLDKAGAPYWEHPARVMMLMGVEATEEERLAALYHDVLEDCDATREDLKAYGLSDAAIDAVELLTRNRDTTTYDEYIDAIIASGNKLAIKVKIADATDNLRGDIPRLHERYKKTLAKLKEVA